MTEEKYSNETLTWALIAFFNAQPKMAEEFGEEMEERQRVDLLDALKRQELSVFSLRSVVTVAAMRSQNEEAAAGPVATFERLIGEKLENIAVP
ncbi:MAG: hypothetical protein BWY53_00163 [Parcubacteria group bacterium ADurb.Bin326]|nr:MAG: hypothetical protein BWY53_00163 [Parcubacteria group bacterium ADurb.Bin326]